MSAQSLTILIPAYNNTDSLIRALETLSEQTIAANLLIIISDDNSPELINREEIFKFSKFFNDLRLVRQATNLGVLSNKQWLFNQVEDDFFAFMEHDDWLIRDDFYERALTSLIEDNSLAAFYGNAITEPSWFWDENGIPAHGYWVMYRLEGERAKFIEPEKTYAYNIGDSKIKGITNDLKIGGRSLAFNLRHSTPSSSFVTSYSSIIYRTSYVRLVGGFSGLYTISWAEANSLNIYREEEHFGLLYLLATRYNFQLEAKPSVVRGWDPKGFSRNFSAHPARHLKQDSAFYAFYKLAWFISKGFTGNVDKDVIRLLYSFCIRIGLVAETDSSQSFLDCYLPPYREIEEMAIYAASRSRKKALSEKFEK